MAEKTTQSITVVFKYEVSKKEVKALISNLGLKIKEYFEEGQTAVVEIPIGSGNYWKKRFEEEDIVRAVSLPKPIHTC